MEGIPILPIVAILAGILILIKADILNWVVAIFLLGFGALGVAKVYAPDVAMPIEAAIYGIADTAQDIVEGE
ncbi:MAG: DUF3096 domain-containing protein [Pseudomonadota bacterium]